MAAWHLVGTCVEPYRKGLRRDAVQHAAGLRQQNSTDALVPGSVRLSRAAALKQVKTGLQAQAHPRERPRPLLY